MKIIINGEIVEVAEGGSGDTTFLVKAPIGTIVIWSGTADNIPSGWQLCDGTNGTPDLRDKFVLGAGTTHSVGETGGSEEVTLTVDEIPSHNHTMRLAIPSEGMTYSILGSNVGNEYGLRFLDSSYTTGEQGKSQTTTNKGGDQPHPNMPPYYALCYIMKLTADPAVDGVTMDQVNTAIQDAVAGIQPQEVYSTEETRIGTWIDGKPLYRRVIVPTTAINLIRDGNSNNITLLTDSTLVLRRGYGQLNKEWSIPHYHLEGNVFIEADIITSGGNIALRGYVTSKLGITTLTFEPSDYLWVALEYTKTTDEATS